MKKRLIFLGMLSIVTMLSFTAIRAASGDVDGTFSTEGHNNAVEINDFKLQNVENPESPTAVNEDASLTPQQTYRAEFAMSDPDAFADLERVELRFIYTPSDETRDFNVTGTPDFGSALVMAWDRSTTASGFEILEADSSIPLSWSIQGSNIPADTEETFTLSVDFTVSEVAPESDQGEWSFGAIITDGGQAGGEEGPRTNEFPELSVAASDPVSALSTFSMDWYGAIDVGTSNQVSWDLHMDEMNLDNTVDDFDRGGVYDDYSTEAELANRPTYTSNGSHEHYFNASSTWDAVDENHTATLVDTDGELGAQEFSLRVNKVDKAFDDTVVQLAEGTDNLGLDYKVNRSMEGGRINNFHLYLRVSPDFQNATYEGTITAGIRPITDTSFDPSVYDEDTLWKVENEGYVPISTRDDFKKLLGTKFYDDQGGTARAMFSDDSEMFGSGFYENEYFNLTDQGAEANYILMNDIDFSSSTFYVKGHQKNLLYDDTTRAFKGVFDGNGHSLNYISLGSSNDEQNDIGVFSKAEGATFRDLSLSSLSIETADYDEPTQNVGGLFGSGYADLSNVSVDGTITGGKNVGGLVGKHEARYDALNTYENITATHHVQATGENAGGIIGHSDTNGGPEIKQSFVEITGYLGVQAQNNAGGLVGYGSVRIFESGSTTLGYPIQTVATNDVGGNNAGGLVGYLTSADDRSRIEDSYSHADVKAANADGAGGLVGLMNVYTAGEELYVERSYSVGNVTNGGAIYGSQDPNFYYDLTDNHYLSGSGNGSTQYGSTAHTQEELRTALTYDSWDFSDTWGINVKDTNVNDSYPFLLWEDHTVSDIRADVEVPQSTMNGESTFTVDAAVGPNHPADFSDFTLELVASDDTVAKTDTFNTSAVDYPHTLDTTTVDDGDYTYRLTVTDSDGTTLTYETDTFTIDNTTN